MFKPSEHSENFVKIKFVEGDNVETLWAVALGNNLFRLDNSPFYAYNVSWQDTIEATEVAEGFYDFVRVVEKSGNRTMRIIFLKFSGNDSEGKQILNDLKNLGCSYEGIDARLISINIPSTADLETVAYYIAERDGIDWEYADPSYDELFPDDDEDDQQDS